MTKPLNIAKIEIIMALLHVTTTMSIKPTWLGVSYADHQEFGINWMLHQESDGYQIPKTDHYVRGGILGDEMGLGKTIQSLALIINSPAKSTLIITPLAVRKQWEDAATKCNLNIYVADKTIWKSLTSIKPSRQTLYLAHYDKVVNDISLFLGIKYDRIILDEAHRIRNYKSSTGINVLRLRARYKWALTATPIVNSLDDAVTYLKFIGFPIDSTSGKWRDSYEPWIRGTYLARTLDQCEAPAGLTMPPDPEINTRLLDFTSKDEETIYTGIYENLESQWRKAQASSGKSAMLAKFSILLRLRQVSVNPQIYIKARDKEEDGWNGPRFQNSSRKFDEISHLLRDAFEAKETHRWIIFCQFHEEMQMLSDFLKAFPFVGNVLQYHGGMSLKARNEELESSKKIASDGKQDVFLIQLQAGGTGLNLQHYDRIIFTSPWWTAALLDQALGRAVRIGQKNIVKVYWLKLRVEGKFSIDDFIMDKANMKRDMGLKFLSWAVGRDEMEYELEDEI